MSSTDLASPKTASKAESNNLLKDCQHLFIAGAVLGVILFVLIYGVKILNPQYIGWIYRGDNDLKQHYIGWSHFRWSQWRFPIGLIESLSYPTPVSVIYTDSIPFAAVFFKLFNSILPLDFQYFGLVGLLSFALTGGTSAVLLRRFINDRILCLLASPVFILSFPIMQRMYFHTALAFQWLILLAFIIWAYDEYRDDIRRSLAVWVCMGFACVSVHSYYLAIIGMVMLADRIAYVFANGDNVRENLIGKIIRAVIPIIGFCISGLLALWIYGGFFGGNSPAGEGLGTFTANFLTFINPMDYGKLLPDLGVANFFQYEGFGYVGAGIIALSLFVDVCFIKNRKAIKLSRIQKINIYSAAGLLILSFAMASLPTLSIGKLMIGQIPYPDVIYRLLSIFRSNGRFIWVGTYLIMTAVIVLAAYCLRDRKKILIAAITGMLVVQGLDLSHMIAQRVDYYYSEHSFDTFWDKEPEYRELTTDKDAFVFMYLDGDLTMETSFFAYRNGMTLNNFYFARNIDKEVSEVLDTYWDELEKGIVRGDTVYILKQEDYNRLKDKLSKPDIKTSMKDDFVIMSINKR